MQDGMRDGEHIRHAMHERFRDVLSQGTVPWIEVRGTPEQRLSVTVSRIDALIDTGWELADPLG